jgi:hypothetical protein
VGVTICTWGGELTTGFVGGTEVAAGIVLEEFEERPPTEGALEEATLPEESLAGEAAVGISILTGIEVANSAATETAETGSSGVGVASARATPNSSKAKIIGTELSKITSKIGENIPKVRLTKYLQTN